MVLEMPSIPFATSAYERARGDLPSLPVVNFFIEQSPTEKNGVILQSRPGLEDRNQTLGAGPVRGMLRRDLVLGTALFAISGNKLYRDGETIGSIDGAGPVSMAGYGNFLFVAAGGRLWGYNGTALAAIVFPDNALVSSILIAGSRLVAIRKDTGQFYWTAPLGTEIDALSFATAENQPDRALQLLFLNGILLIFGSETVEYWPLSNDPDLPFQVLQGQVIQKGIRGTGCAVQIGSTFAWVSNENRVLLANEETVISNNGLQERIAASEDVSLWTFTLGGNEYIALRLDDETQIYDVKAQKWFEWKSYGYDNWVPRCFSDDVFGSAYDGRTMRWSEGWEDLGGVLERRFRAGMVIDAGGTPISNVAIRTNVGQTSYLTGAYAEPAVEMRQSRDGGKTWQDWRSQSLGKQGAYRTHVSWRSLGMASRPSLLLEFRCSAPVDLRVSDVLANEVTGGRT